MLTNKMYFVKINGNMQYYKKDNTVTQKDFFFQRKQLSLWRIWINIQTKWIRLCLISSYFYLLKLYSN